MVAPKGMFPAKSLVPATGPRVEPEALQCGYVKDLELLSSWIIWVGPKSNQSPYQGHTEKPREDGDRDWRDTATPEGGAATTEAPPLPPGLRGKVRPCPCLDFGLLASRAVKERLLLL